MGKPISQNALGNIYIADKWRLKSEDTLICEQILLQQVLAKLDTKGCNKSSKARNDKEPVITRGLFPPFLY